jgi:hypothetical protein
VALEGHTAKSWILSTVSLDTELKHSWRAFTVHLSGDVPMSRIKMNAKHEYEFIANFKVLQTVFKTKKIDKVRIQWAVISANRA